MKKTIVWLMLSCLVVTALVLASCAPAERKPAPAEEKPAPAEEKPAPVVKPVTPEEKPGMVKVRLTKVDGTVVEKWMEKPKYGGVLNLDITADPHDFDGLYRSPHYTYTLDMTNDCLTTNAWMRGPSGTDEIDNTSMVFVSPSLNEGVIAESWEFPDPLTMIFHIRKGVRFHNKPPLNGREVVASDVAFSMRRLFDAPISTLCSLVPAANRPIAIETPDKYTVVLKFAKYNSGVFGNITSTVFVTAPEAARGESLRDWRNAIGTGAFMLIDYVRGSCATLTKNPDYWMKDPFFPENTLPYVDVVKLFVIPDLSTRVAALRTGKLDVVWDLPGDQMENLEKTNPWLKKYPRVTSSGGFSLRVDRPPFNDIRARKAVQMAIDQDAYLKMVLGGHGLRFGALVRPSLKEYFMPLEKYPPSIQELFTYNPEKAKRLLAEAGYPKGFKTEILCQPPQAEDVSFVKSYLDAIGVETAIKIVEPAVWTSMAYARTYDKCYWYGQGSQSIETTFEWWLLPDSQGNRGWINDPKINGGIEQVVGCFDEAERKRLAKELAAYTLEQAYHVHLPVPVNYIMWQPWLKGYSGERQRALYQYRSTFKFVWLDPALKRKMVGRE